MTDTANGYRRLRNWIESFTRYSNVLPSPAIFRKWAAISTIGAVLERRVWSQVSGFRLYPNLYVVLVGPPGVGKSAICRPVDDMLRSLRDFFVAPSSLTTASMVDALNDAKRPIFINREPVTFNSLQVIASELGVFLPAYDPSFMNTLTKLYDGEFYEEKRRTGKVSHVRIENPQLSILGGTTPSYLNSFLPEGAWDQGFISRTILVYHPEQELRIDIFNGSSELDPMLKTDLHHDLTIVKELVGRIMWGDDASRAINKWHEGGEKPVPRHAKLQHYNARRLTHLIKLSMIAAVSRSSSMLVTGEDYEEAFGWLTEVEELMPDIFQTMGVSADARAIEDLIYLLEKRYEKNRSPIGEHVLVNFLKDRVPAHSIMKIVEIMVKSKKVELKVEKGIVGYIPLH